MWTEFSNYTFSMKYIRKFILNVNYVKLERMKNKGNGEYSVKTKHHWLCKKNNNVWLKMTEYNYTKPKYLNINAMKKV